MPPIYQKILNSLLIEIVNVDGASQYDAYICLVSPPLILERLGISIFIDLIRIMNKTKYAYLVWVQYLGFRYSGWQKQPGQKTLEGMLLKTLKFIDPGKQYKILGAGRTDAKVSAIKMAFQLLTSVAPIEDLPSFVHDLNQNLPSDIRILEMQVANPEQNIIQNAKIKEYGYIFSFGNKNHPFCAPFMANFLDELDLPLMMRAANIFEGTHNFQNFTARIQPNTKVIRTIDHCEILENKEFTANFFPKKSYLLLVRGEGFMRYQIRMMMGALVLLGKGELDFQTFQKALTANDKLLIPYVAPGSGLFLRNMEFK